jgi:hypothetical protein
MTWRAGVIGALNCFRMLYIKSASRAGQNQWSPWFPADRTRAALAIQVRLSQITGDNVGVQHRVKLPAKK